MPLDQPGAALLRVNPFQQKLPGPFRKQPADARQGGKFVNILETEPAKERLTPRWMSVLVHAGFAATLGSTLDATDAPDTEIMRYALEHDGVVLTHDLDLGDVLAAAQGALLTVDANRTRLFYCLLHKLTSSPNCTSATSYNL